MSEMTPETELSAADLVASAQFKVCGVVLDASFTFAELGRWKDFAKERGVAALEARLSKAATGAGQELRPKGRFETQEKLVESLEKAVANKLKKLENDPLSWTDEDGALLEQVAERLDSERAKLDALQADPETVIATAERHFDLVNKLQYERRTICLEFVHLLATERGQTKEKLATWQKRAKGQDLVNAAEVIRLGNAPWNSGARASRHFQPKPKSRLN